MLFLLVAILCVKSRETGIIKDTGDRCVCQYTDTNDEAEKETLEQREEYEQFKKRNFSDAPVVDVKRSVIRGIVEGTKYNTGKSLEPGDLIEVTGEYVESKDRFSINLMTDAGDYFLHFSFRPRRDTVFNTKFRRRWGKEIRPAKGYFPRFEKGKQFRITIVCSDEYFKILFNGDAIPNRYPYRDILSDVKYVMLVGRHIKWRKINISTQKENDSYYMTRMVLATSIRNIENKLTKDLEDKQTQEDIKLYLNSAEGSLTTLQWRLFNNIYYDQDDTIDINDETIKWIINDKDALETFMLSGDVENQRKALVIMSNIIKKDPGAKNGLKLRLATATGLEFSSGVTVYAYYMNTTYIDPYERYESYARWSKEGVLWDPFFKISTWHLRYVVRSRALDSELVWARANIDPKYNSPETIGSVCGSIPYRRNNKDGASVFNSTAYYYNKPRTLDWAQKIGAVCGGCSHFSAEMAQAFGIPSITIGQPGHCAYTYLKNGQWKLGYDISGWAKSVNGKTTPWSESNMSYLLLMNTCQYKQAVYRLSEKMRLAAPFIKAVPTFLVLVEAANICPQNFPVWKDMRQALNDTSLTRSDVQSSLAPTIKQVQLEKLKIHNIALDKKITADCNLAKATNINNRFNTSWCCDKETASFEIDFGNPVSVNGINIQWFGWSKPKNYDLYARDMAGNYKLVKTQKDESISGWFNHWSTFTGWNMITTRLKVNMRDGKKDCWEKKWYFGIRLFQVNGVEYDYVHDISTNKHITTTDPINNKGLSALLDSNPDTIWSAKSSQPSFRIDLKRISCLSNVKFDWYGSSKPDSIELKYRVGKEKGVTLDADGNIDQIIFPREEKNIATSLGVQLNGRDLQLRGFTVMGVSYTIKEILKMKVETTWGNYDCDFPEQNMLKEIDNYQFQD